MQKKPLKVGLDLDGVILYNPARIARPIIKNIKKVFFPKRTNKFYIPKKKWEQLLWQLLHKSSMFVAGGFDEIRKMAEDKDIELYIITARFNYLQKDFEKWLTKIDARTFCIDCFHNTLDEQPHLYKKNLIEKLDLDIFVEDNWDIVHHLSTTLTKRKPAFKPIWVYNIADKIAIDYPYRVPNLKEAVKIIQDDIKKLRNK